MELVARCANQSDFLEVGESIPARTSTTLSPMPRLVHLPAPACHALLCLCLLMATRSPQGHLSSRLARRGARDRDAQQPCCDASSRLSCPVQQAMAAVVPHSRSSGWATIARPRCQPSHRGANGCATTDGALAAS